MSEFQTKETRGKKNVEKEGIEDRAHVKTRRVRR
jgi:hypothetical protein